MQTTRVSYIKRLLREERRLVDAYQVGITELEELEDRRTQIAQQRKALRAQYEQRSQLRRQAAQAREVLEDLETFCRRINVLRLAYRPGRMYNMKRQQF